MQRDDALSRLRNLRPHFKDMKIKRLVLFGSTARNEAGPDSDVDLLIDMEGPAGLVTLARKKREMEKYLGCNVDLYPLRGISQERHPDVIKEMIDV